MIAEERKLFFGFLSYCDLVVVGQESCPDPGQCH